MSKKFNIHDWHAKRRQQLLTEGVWEVGNKQDIQEFIAKLTQLKNVYFNIVGSDEVQNGLDAALKAAEELIIHAKPGVDEHHEEGTFPEVDQKTKDYLDKLEKSDPSAYKAVEDYIKAMGDESPQADNSMWTSTSTSDAPTDTEEEEEEKSKPNWRDFRENTTGTGASVGAGAGEAFATPKAFKKKRK